MNNLLPFSGLLAMYSYHVNPICTLCNNHIETGEHSLMSCSFAKAVWAHYSINLDLTCNGVHNLTEWCNSWFSRRFPQLIGDLGQVCVLPSASLFRKPGATLFSGI